MLLTIKDLTVEAGSKKLLDQVKLIIEDKDKIGIIGKNGNGKSTFLKVIATLDNYVSGTFIKGKNYRLNYVSQEQDFKQDDTPYSFIRRNLDPKDQIEDYIIHSTLSKLGVYEYDTPVNTMSGGTKKRIGLALGLIRPCDLLILDEPTNHLDYPMIHYLENYLMNYNKALIMVTHDRYFLENVVNKIIEIDMKKLFQYEANYSKYLILKEERINQLLMQDYKRKQFLKKEIQWVKAGVQARTTKSKSRLDRYYELESKENYQVDEELSLDEYYTRLGSKTIELNNVSYSINDKVLINNFSYIFKKQDRIGIVGPNGIGKTTLLKLIANLIQPNNGTIDIGDTVNIGFFRQENESLETDKKVFQFIQELNHDNNGLSTKKLLEGFLFNEDNYQTKICDLSGGEKRRLSLITTLIKKPNVLLLDEPTNDLDIPTLSILEKYLANFKGIIITVSHDRYFLDNIVDTTFVFKENGLIDIVNGSYSTYHSLTNNKPVKEKKEYVKAKKLKMTYLEQKEFETIDEVVAMYEYELKQIEKQMNLVSDDYNKVMELVYQQKKVQEKLDEANDRWLYLNELHEAIMNQ